MLLKRFNVLFFLFALVFSNVVFSKSVSVITGAKERELVSSLYDSSSKGKSSDSLAKLLSLSQSDLSAIFNAELTRLIIDEAKCVNEGFVCNLDFDPLYGSQDPLPKRISFTNSKNKILVSFLERGKSKVIVYTFASTSAGLKVSNVLYPNGSNLKSILSQR